MPASISVSRLRSFLNDADGDNVADPGDTFHHTIIVTNGAGEDATNVITEETENGYTIDPGSFNIGPIAINDVFNGVVGNTPFTITSAQLVGNDLDPDDALTPNLYISEINGTAVVDVNGDPIAVTVNVTNGTITSELDGDFVFTPTTGFEGAASFTYEVTDEDGVTSVAATPGNVTINVVDCVWYVDADATPGGDGSYGHAFTSLAPLVNGGTSDGLDDDNDTIFVYNSTNSLAGGLQLENGQDLRGEGTGTAFTANGITITAGGVDSVINHSTFGIELGQNNTILGVDFVGSDANGVAIRDNTGTAGTLTISETEVSGTGQIIDVDNGGTLAVTFESVASSGSNGSVTGSGAIDLSGVQGTFTVSGATNLTGGSHTGGGIDITNSSNALTVNLAAVTVNSGIGDAINYTGNTSGSVLNITGAADLDTTAGVGLDITGNNGGTINITGGALDIDTGSGTGINASSVILNITGANNDVSSTNGGTLLNMSASSVGGSGVSFDTLSTGASTTVGAIIIDNLDGGTFHANTITITGTLAGDGINISNGSAATFDLDNVTVSNSFQDGVELNGANGVVDIDNISIQTAGTGGAGGQGLEIVGATQLVDIDSGSIGSTNDPSLEAVLISGGTGQVDINATLAKTTSGNIVEVTGHSVGAINFTGNFSATDGNGPINGEDNGILINNNASGTIAFSGAAKTLNTGTFDAVTIISNGANVDFTGGNLDIDTTSGDGITAGTTSTATGGTLTVSGSSNSISTGTGSALVLNGTDSDGLTFHFITKIGGTATGIFLKDAGSGGLTVTGSGSTAGSGGTLQNITGANGSGNGTGVYVEDTNNISLSNMTFTGPMTNYGIRGIDVVNFTLRDSTFTGAYGDDFGAPAEGTIIFNNLTGLGLFEGNNIAGGLTDNMRIVNAGSGTLNLFFRDTAGGDAAIFGSNGTTNNANDSLNVQATGDSNILMLVDGVEFTAWRGDGIQASAFDTSNLEATIRNSTFHNTHSNIASAGGIGVLIGGTAGGGGWTVDYTVEDNAFSGSKGMALAASFNGFGGTARGFIDGNTIGTPGGGYTASGSSEAGGIDVAVEKTGTIGAGGELLQYVTISNNTIRDVNKSGIQIRATSGDDAVNNARVEATVNSNTVSEMGGASSFAAFRGLAGGGSNDFGQIGLDMNNNTFNVSGTIGAYSPILLDQIPNTPSKYYMPGYNGQDGELYGGTGSTSATTYFVGRGNTLVPDNDGTPQLSPTNVYAADARMDPGALQTAQTGSNTQLPTGALQATPAPSPTPDVAPAPYVDPTPQTPASGDGGNSGGGSGGGDPDPTPSVDPAPPAPVLLTQAALDTLVEAAIERWIDAGATAEQVAAMRATNFSVADMSGLYLGTSSAGTVQVDSDAAGYGWFIDSTPGEDGEYGGGGSRLAADAGGAADGKMDLLTVLMHELGHQLGLNDDYNSNQADELMYGYANIGERRLPEADDLIGADLSHAGHEAFVLSSPAVPLLPQNKAVKIEFTSTVIGLTDGIYLNDYSNTSKITGNTFAPVTSAPEALTIDSLTLGDRVYVDANNNNLYDAGEGVAGVDVTLFADTDDSGDLSVGDVELATDITDANGVYGFINLSQGDFIVRVDAENFDTGGALEGRLTGTGSADPDDTNADGDDNGIAALGGSIASKAITLTYNGEPTSDGGVPPKNDVNNTLDFGFIIPNQAPVITSPATASGNEDTVIAVTGISVADVDAGTDPVKVTLTVASGTLNVTVTTGLTITGANSGTLTLEGNLTDLNAGLASLGYTPVADFNGGPITLNINANDNGNNGPDPGVGDPLSEEDSATVAITVNAVVDIDDDTVNLAEDAGATSLTGANDPLGNDSFENSGRAITAVSDPTNGTATIDDNNTTLDLTDDFIVYTPDADYNGADSFTYTVTSGGVTETETITVNLSAVNDEPTGTDDTITAIEDTFRILGEIDFGFDDVDTGDVLSEVIITGVTGGSLYIDTGADGFDAGDAVSSFPATVTAAQLGGNLVAFKASDDANGAGIGEITFKVVDDSGAANDTSLADNTLIVDVTAVNDAPELVASGGNTAFTEGENVASTPVAVDTGITVDDVDSAIATATVEVTTGVAAEDVLAFVNNNAALYGNIAVTGGAGTDTISLASAGSTATLTQWQNALRAVTYTNTSDNPTVTDRVVTFTVNDGTDPSNSPTKTVTIAAADDDSSATGDSGTTTESGTVTIDVIANDSDPDGPTPSVVKIGTTSIAPGGTVTLSNGAKVTLELDGRLTYDPFGQFDDLAKFGQGASNDTGADSFTYTLANGGVATVNITVQGQYSVPHIMLGTNGADNITGTVVDDIFAPGTGADTMTGSGGDDAYTIDNVGDLPVEAFGQGTDTVFTTLANYALHKHIENLVLLSGGVNGTGNQLENGMIGNDDANILDGMGGADAMAGEGGDDTYIVQNSGDEAIETSALDGHDTVFSSASAFTLGAFVEDLILTGAGLKGTGNGLDNVITGNSRGNTIDGKAGADTMTGAQGDDTYTVDNVGDQVIELGDGGIDTVKSSVSFRLGDGVNHLELTGTAANGTGNNLSNIITGNASANILKGVNGNDKLLGGGDDDSLYGGAGNDVLRGDGGADGFYFDARLDGLTNVDTIVDYSVADDSIFLNKSYFKDLPSGTLNPWAFHTGAAAGDASDRIIYDSATGNLYYDSDGTGADAQILFAKLDSGLALTNADFVLYI